ncbi:hypothetical protein PLESTB_001270700 [Pleodorina starrii]|uniref:Uncharacterized protein n=1 Tax=Pleodorina starrii TaxID=330485 RepID=A0A9W6F684_9CHLO|nr:hypothetical protein PLESTB_001270700 [Pleodorina starrii]
MNFSVFRSEEDPPVRLSVAEEIFTVSYSVLTQFPHSTLARMAHWRRSAGLEVPLRLDSSRPELVMLLLHWLSVRYLYRQSEGYMAGLAEGRPDSEQDTGDCPPRCRPTDDVNDDSSSRCCRSRKSSATAGAGTPRVSAADSDDGPCSCDGNSSDSTATLPRLSSDGSSSGSISTGSISNGSSISNGTTESGESDAMRTLEDGPQPPSWYLGPEDHTTPPHAAAAAAVAVVTSPNLQPTPPAPPPPTTPDGHPADSSTAAPPPQAVLQEANTPTSGASGVVHNGGAPPMESPRAAPAELPYSLSAAAVRQRRQWPYDGSPPLPALPPPLQAEMDCLLDYLGLTAEVYGSLPHVYGIDLPHLLARHDAAPLFSYHSRPSAMTLDGRHLGLRARGYAHASAPLTAASAAAVGAGGGAAAAAAPPRKLLWKLRLSHRGSVGVAGVRAACRPDTSLGVLLVHVEEGSYDRPPLPPTAARPSTALPVISQAAAAAWSGPLPLLAAALPQPSAGHLEAPAAAAAAAATVVAGSGRSSLHVPGFFGWHMAGLAKAYDGADLSGAAGGAAGGVITRVALPPAPSGLQNLNGVGGGACGTGDGGGGGLSYSPYFFEDGDVLLFALDPAARRLEMHHRRLGASYSVALPPPPPPQAAAAGADAAGVREVPYAHVCMYDVGEGLEVLDVALEDLQLMGCV